ncbi:hypothetical protein MSAN_02231700 [Mycena sanguinolenta]|uniref:MYND-type domain-containing protein n=1 Tax=Mycena sanguinolenta TaxID=230812 RepID=A0A8H7CH86_9AGAR|nr:hypothetical protein MSAN_02231700 [Mycena sanguinolenta]
MKTRLRYGLRLPAQVTMVAFSRLWIGSLKSACLLQVHPASQLSSTAATPSSAELYEGYSFLHLAIDLTDPPFACEAIRHGTPIDQKSGRGQTPLLHALERLRELRAVLKISNISIPSLQEFQYKARLANLNAIDRVRYIIRVLIAQHADVDSTGTWKGGKVVSSLHFACAMGDWDLIALLLEHGAKSKPTPACADAEDFLMEATDKRRFRDMKVNPRTSRPPRLCPCFSGKPRINCHSQRLPYPDDFTCSCGSTKAYGKCCKGRNIDLVEEWIDETQTIRLVRETVISHTFRPPPFMSPEVMETIMNEVQNNKEKFTKMMQDLMWDSEFQSVYAECFDIGCQNDNITDPAFRFAYSETKFFPFPQGRSSSKHYCRQKQKEWNFAVDKYIAGGTDSRPRLEIETAAKIGISLGAMYRACEADGCDKVEGRELEKVSTCSRCKMTFYCGPICQKAHWPTHKSICGTAEQTERPLPSQVAVSNFVSKYGPALTLYRMGSEYLEQLLEMD